MSLLSLLFAVGSPAFGSLVVISGNVKIVNSLGQPRVSSSNDRYIYNGVVCVPLNPFMAELFPDQHISIPTI